MITYENECVGCPPEMGCIGNSCPYMNVKHFHCDCCEEDFDPSDLRYYKNQYICKECYLAQAEDEWENCLDMVNVDDE